MTVDLCRNCDSACCRVFYLPLKITGILYVVNEIVSSIRSGSMNIRRLGYFSRRLWCVIFYWLFTARIKDADVIASSSSDGKYTPPLRCRLVTKWGCWLYWIRPSFCSCYKCHGQVQIWHTVAHRRGIPIPDHARAYMEEMKARQIEAEAFKKMNETEQEEYAKAVVANRYTYASERQSRGRQLRQRDVCGCA